MELDYLDVDRFNTVKRSSNQFEEDLFCQELRKLGASWWALPPEWPEYTIWCETITACIDPKIRIGREVGFTKDGGVWVLNTSNGWDSFPAEIGGLYNALTMKERCAVLEKLGGVFCKDIDTCPEMQDLIREIQVPHEPVIGELRGRQTGHV